MVDRFDEESVLGKLEDLKVTEAKKACIYQLKEEEIDRSKQRLTNAFLWKIFTHKKISSEIFK